MHAPSMSESGAFRIVIAVALAAVITFAIGAFVSVTAGIVVGIAAFLAGVAYETHHLF